LPVLALFLGKVYGQYYAGRVFPGVRAGDVSLGGLTLAQAEARVREALPAVTREITLRDPLDGRSWTYPPAALGLNLDPRTLTDAAYRAGREGGATAALGAPFAVRLSGYDVLAEMPVFDRARAEETLRTLAAEVDVAPVDAGLRLEAGELIETPPTLGHQLDLDITLERLASLATDPRVAALDLAVTDTAPRIFDLGSVAAAYRTIISGPVHLIWEDDMRETVSQAQLFSWTTIEPVANPQGDDVPSIVFDHEAMRQWVAPLAERINRPAVNARFSYDANTGQVSVLRPGQSSILLDIDGTVKRIVEAAYTPERTTAPRVQVKPPRVPASAVRRVANLEEVARSATALQGTPEGRIRNILLAVERFHGVILEPGAEFSFNHFLGEVSEATGYDMSHVDAAAAVGPDMATDGLGGGIGQTATTAFRAAFWAGLPITERHAPAYRVGWVEPPVGMDATVDGTRQDLRFVNDTGGFILSQVEIDHTRVALVWTLYGEPDGRRVETVGPTVSNVQPARIMVVRQDERLAPGTRQQVAWAREGAHVTVERMVLQDGQARRQDMFTSQYRPWPDVVLEGPSE